MHTYTHFIFLITIRGTYLNNCSSSTEEGKRGREERGGGRKGGKKGEKVREEGRQKMKENEEEK